MITLPGNTFRKTVPGLLAAALALALAGEAAEGSAVATWTGAGGDGLWTNPANWSPAVVPLNDESDTYTVIVPGTPNITLDNGLAEAIDSLSFDGNGDLVVAGGTALDVIGVSLIAAHVFVDGAGSAFTSDAFGANLQGNARLHATGGGLARVNAGSYTHVGLANVGSATIMSADGADSLVDLSALSSFTDGFDDAAGVGNPVHWHTVEATNGGVVDMSNAAIVVGSPGNDVLRFRVATDGFVDLASVNDISRRSRFEIDVPFYEVPSLLSIVTTAFDVRAGATFSVPLLETLDSSTMLVEPGATISAPSLEAFTRCTMTLVSGAAFDAPALLDIDGTRIQATEGTTFAFTNTTFDNTMTSDVGNVTYFSAVGAGSMLDFSTIETYTDTHDDAAGVGNPTNTRTILAADGGVVDLSNVTTLTAAGGNDRLRLQVDPGGTIDLSSLESMPGRPRIDVNSGTFELPQLTATDDLLLSLAIGTTLSVPVLTDLPGTANAMNFQFASVLDAPLLESTNRNIVDLPPGAIMDVPSMHTFTESRITLLPGAQFNTAPLTDVDGSRFEVRDGVNFAVADTEYVNTYTSDSGNHSPFIAASFGTVLDLSSVETYRDNFDDAAGVGNPTIVRTNVATTGAVIDLSNATLVEANPGNDILRFSADAGGTIAFGDTTLDGRIGLIVDGDGSSILVATPTLDDTVTITLTDAGRLTVTGDLAFPHTNEASFSLQGGVFELNGTGPQRLEVGGEDLGAEAFTEGNFGIGQLVIGSDDNAATVRLVDAVDNDNRIGDALEALYVYGLPADGLSILGGSTLLLPQQINLYAAIDDEMVHINGLFDPRVTEIVFDEGTIRLLITGDLDEDGFVSFNDLLILLAQWGPCPDPPAECSADLDGDGEVGFTDLLLVLAAWS